MANNPYVNKVELADGTVLIDLTGDTVSSGALIAGYKAHDKSGAQISGTIQNRDSTNIQFGDGTVKLAESGYYPKNTQKDIPKGSTSVGVSLGNNGYIVATAIISAGYQSRGSASGSLQLDTEAGATITPTRSTQTAIAENTFATGDIYVGPIPSNYYTLAEIYPVGSLWATSDGTKNPATELGFGTWKQVSPVKPTWKRLKMTTTWADMQTDAPQIYVWRRLS